MTDLAPLSLAIEQGDRELARQITRAALAEGARPRDVLDAMTAAMGAVGRRFQANEIFVPEMLVAARAMKEAMGILEPALVEAGILPGDVVDAALAQARTPDFVVLGPLAISAWGRRPLP